MAKKLVIASHNKDKAKEIAEFLAPYGFEVITAGEAGVDEPEETENTFAGNALLKARNCAIKSGLISLADDSGLEVDALNGAPGIYSARWGGSEKNFLMAMQRVEDEIKNKSLNPEGAKARFVCALALVFPDGREEVMEGTVEGTLTFPPRGSKGFGYDPIFIPNGYSETFGELASTVKSSISHRARAFEKFRKFCELNFS